MRFKSIEINAGACYGTCVPTKMQITDNLNVCYEKTITEYVQLNGTYVGNSHTAQNSFKLSDAEYQHIYLMIMDSDFFNLSDEYTEPTHDLQRIIMKITCTCGTQKTITISNGYSIVPAKLQNCISQVLAMVK